MEEKTLTATEIKKAEKVINKIIDGEGVDGDVITKMLNKANITDDVLGRVLAEGLEANMELKLNTQGATMTVPDMGNRHKYLLVALELKKYLKDKAVLIQNGIFNDPSIEADAKRILALRQGTSNG